MVAFSAIFFVVDPIAIVPIFIAMTPNDDDAKRKAMAARACLVAAGLLVFFAVGGNLLFQMFGVTLAAFKIAGGVLLLMTAFEQLQNHPHATKTSGEEIQESAEKDDIAIVPLAMPMLAGPGAIATVMVLADAWWKLIPIVGAIIVTCGTAYGLLRGAKFVNHALGATGRAIMGRVMGLLLAAIAVQFMVTGLREAFPELLTH